VGGIAHHEVTPMSDAERLADMRELFLRAPESAAVQWVALLLALGLAGIVLWLVRRRTLRAEYTPIWMAAAAGILLAALNLDLLRVVTRLIGAWTVSSTLFFLGQFFLLAICLNYAVRLSQAGAHLRALAQELALLRRRIEDLEAGGPAGDGARS
jgi:hypothetical protein